MLKVLIVEGNTLAYRELMVDLGKSPQGILYQRVLESLDNSLDCTIVYPADEEAALPSASELDAYDGVVWTGSALNIYDGGPAIDRQIDFMKLCFETGTRLFGSCWGLQMATVALGGVVEANKKGREIGIARDIAVTQAGAEHPLYRGKAQQFDAVAVHLDHVVALPEGSTVLSGNAISEVQAVEIKHGSSIFWGVQYHPEFDLDYIGGIIRRYREPLLAEGFCETEEAVEEWAQDFEAVERDSSRTDLIEKRELGEDVTDCSLRLLELSNWLSFLANETAKDLISDGVGAGS